MRPSVPSWGTCASVPFFSEGCTHQSWKMRPENPPALWACSYPPTMLLSSSSIAAHIPPTSSSTGPRPPENIRGIPISAKLGFLQLILAFS